MRQGCHPAEIVIDGFVTVNAGLKSGLIPIEIQERSGRSRSQIGDFVAVAIESIEDGFAPPNCRAALKSSAWLDLKPR
jgi:small subunit ribosomal protein S1